MKNKGQLKIQQMAFVVMGIFLFFILVALFFVGWQYRSVQGSFEELQTEQAISFLKVVADMPELNCDARESLCLDEDKVRAMSSGNLGKTYEGFWPVASIKVYKIYPAFVEEGTIECPLPDCNYYDIYNSGQSGLKEFSTYVSLCRPEKYKEYVYENCEIAKLLVGVKDGGA
jgi:hypothetical protein